MTHSSDWGDAVARSSQLIFLQVLTTKYAAITSIDMQVGNTPVDPAYAKVRPKTMRRAAMCVASLSCTFISMLLHERLLIRSTATQNG